MLVPGWQRASEFVCYGAAYWPSAAHLGDSDYVPQCNACRSAAWCAKTCGYCNLQSPATSPEPQQPLSLPADGSPTPAASPEPQPSSSPAPTASPEPEQQHAVPAADSPPEAAPHQHAAGNSPAPPAPVDPQAATSPPPGQPARQHHQHGRPVPMAYPGSYGSQPSVPLHYSGGAGALAVGRLLACLPACWRTRLPARLPIGSTSLSCCSLQSVTSSFAVAHGTKPGAMCKCLREG